MLLNAIIVTNYPELGDIIQYGTQILFYFCSFLVQLKQKKKKTFVPSLSLIHEHHEQTHLLGEPRNKST